LAATLILVAAAGSILFIVSDGILGSHVIRWFTSFHLSDDENEKERFSCRLLLSYTGNV
jgi:hypothetical protein